jgi:hypothetical protein
MKVADPRHTLYKRSGAAFEGESIMTTRQVFISYSLSDADWVSHVRDQIVGAGLTAYLAVHDMQPGRDVVDKIQKAIDASAAVIVVLTKNATASTWVQQEIGYASRGGKLVVPLVSPSVAATPEVLGMLNGVEYVQFDPDDPEPGLRALGKWAIRFEESARQKDQQELFLILAGILLVVAVIGLSQGG